MKDWKQLIKPVAVLFVICVVITGALAFTNDVTKPIIDEVTRVAQEKARRELLPEANGFTERETDVPNVDSIYVADNGAGTVVTSRAKGYGGTMTVLTAFGPDGRILRIKVTESSETQGIGSKVARDPSFWTRFEGLGESKLVLGKDVDALSGASVSSKALVAAINAAIDGYHAAMGK